MDDATAGFCPVCGASGSEQFCAACGFDRAGAAATTMFEMAARIRDLDAQISTASGERADLAARYDRLRWEAAPPPAASLWAPPVRTAPRDPAEWSADSVRSTLLWVGAALLAASALTFTAVAWSHLGDGGRASALIGVTAVFAAIGFSLRRRLPVSADAFTMLSTAMVLIDWHALHRAGVGSGVSGVAWWAIGSLVASAYVAGFGGVVGARSRDVAVAVLLPLAGVLTVFSLGRAQWSFSLGMSVVAGAVTVAEGRVRDANRAVTVTLLRAEAIAAWGAAAFAAGLAAYEPSSFRASLLPAAVIGALALAPAAAVRWSRPRDRDQLLLAVVIAVPLGVLVALSASFANTSGIVTWAALLGSALLCATARADDGWRRPALAAGSGFMAGGVLWAGALTMMATFGPLAWVAHPWTATFGNAASTVYAGPLTRHPFPAGWALVWTLGALAAAIAAQATRDNAWRPFVAAPLVAAVCVAPIIAGASAYSALMVALATTMLVVLAAAALDRRRSNATLGLLLVALLAAIPLAGWSAGTRDASIAVLAIAAGLAVVAWTVARTDAVRSTFAVAAAAALVALAGVWTLASGASVGAAGFAIAVTSGAVLCGGVHGFRRSASGRAVEIAALAGGLVGAYLAAYNTAYSDAHAQFWLALTLTVWVGVFSVAALARGRAVVYGWAAAGAALSATFAWLAYAHVGLVEAYTLPAAALALAAGVFGWRTGPARSWLTLGPAIVIALAPTLLLGIAQDDSARLIAAAVFSFIVLVAGAWQRLQAPLVLGAGALGILAIDTFGPAAARLPKWVPLAVIGVLLMWIGATFERRRDAARRVTQGLMRFG